MSCIWFKMWILCTIWHVIYWKVFWEVLIVLNVNIATLLGLNLLNVTCYQSVYYEFMTLHYVIKIKKCIKSSLVYFGCKPLIVQYWGWNLIICTHNHFNSIIKRIMCTYIVIAFNHKPHYLHFVIANIFKSLNLKALWENHVRCN
jgi:hypothetical protein